MVNITCTSKESDFPAYWIDGVFRMLLIFTGLTVNSMAIWILLTTKKLQGLFNHLLVYLFAANNFCLVCLTFLLLFHHLHFQTKSIICITAYLAYPFRDILLTASVLITVCLSHERYTALQDPHGYATNMAIARNRSQRLRKYVLFVAIFSLCFNCLKFFEFTVVEDENKLEIGETSLGGNINFKLCYIGIRMLIFLVVSFLTLIFSNCMTWKRITKTWKQFNNIAADKQGDGSLTNKNSEYVGLKKIQHVKSLNKQQRLAFALFALVLVFAVCNGLFFAIELTASLTDRRSCNFGPLTIIRRMILTIYLCVNVFVYCMASKEFRKYFLAYLQYLVSVITCNYVSKSNQQFPSTKWHTIELKTKTHPERTETHPTK